MKLIGQETFLETNHIIIDYKNKCFNPLKIFSISYKINAN